MSFRNFSSSNRSCVISNETNTTHFNYTNCLDDATDGKIFSDKTLVIIHTCYVIVLCTGLFGNILTCAVIVIRQSMRRSIHFYTFNLAICDLFILLFYVPTQMVWMKEQLVWTMGLTMCKIVNVVLPVALVSSVGTLLAITIDRARAMIQPFKWRVESKRNSKIIIPAIWITAFIFNIPLFVFPKLEYDYFSSAPVLVCSEGWPNPNIGKIYWVGMFVLVYAIPLLAIIVAHILMIIALMRDKRSMHRQQNKRMLQRITPLVIVFLICTGFQHIYYLLMMFSNITFSANTSALMFSTSNFVVSLQAALNPIIYGTLRQDFNRAFRAVLVKILVILKLHKAVDIDIRSPSIGSRLLSTYSPLMSERRSTVPDQFSLRFLDNGSVLSNDCDSPIIIPMQSFSNYNRVSFPCNIDSSVAIKQMTQGKCIYNNYENIIESSAEMSQNQYNRLESSAELPNLLKNTNRNHMNIDCLLHDSSDQLYNLDNQLNDSNECSSDISFHTSL